jgi:O-antigen/teichoic acid export membrane protein
MTPYYISNLGPESYGLVAFFSLLSTWMNLLDLGMTPTLSREVSAARSIENGMNEFRKLLRSFEMIFFVISVFAFILIFIFRNWLSIEWIKSTDLSTMKISKCIVVMGILIGFRWFSSLYRSVIVGFEYQVGLNVINVIFTTLKFVGVMVVFKFLNNDIITFFEYQLFLGLIEVVILMFFVYNKLPQSDFKIPIISFYWLNIKNVIPFTLGIAYSSAIWIFVSQVDKLVLSGILNLKDFGYFNLVIVVASTITTLAGPISQAVLPRMVYMFSIKNNIGMLDLYKSATQMVVLISSSITIILALFSEQIIFAWTGNIEAANWSKDVLFWYALGSGVLSILSFQHYLQVAVGQLKLQVWGGTLSFIIDVPIIIFISIKYGPEGAGIVWFILRSCWFLFWTPYVHNKYAPGLHMKWVFNDIAIIIITVFLTAVFLKTTFPLKSINRVEIFAHILITGLVVLIIGSLSSSYIRKKLQ